MTTEATPKTAIETAQEAVNEAKEALDKATAASAETTQKILSVQPLDLVALAEATAPVAKAQAIYESRMATLKDAKANDVWEQSIAVREPILEAIRAMLIDAPISVTLESVSGSLKIEDGKVSVSLTPVLGKIDMSTIEAAIAEKADPKGFAAVEISAVDISVTDIGKENALVSLALPSSKATKAKATGTSDGTRAGSLEYNYKGEWLGAKAFVTAVESNGEKIATDRKPSFDTVLRGTGNGLSNLAKDAAKKLGVESREVVKE